MTERNCYDVIVIGGGIGGLVAAYECSRAGKTVLLLEKEESLGGRIQTAELAGVTVDTGAESFATRTDSVATLAGELGIGDLLIAPSSNQSWLYNYDGGDSYPAVAPTILGIPDMTAVRREELSAVVGEEAYLYAARDLTTPWNIPEEGLAGMSLAELIERRLGRDIVMKFVAPTVKAIYAVDPYQVSVDALAPGFSEAAAERQSVSRAALALKNRCANAISDRANGQSGINTVMSFSKGMMTLVSALTVALENSPFVDIALESVTIEEGGGNRQVRYISGGSAVPKIAWSKAVVNACADRGSPPSRSITTVVVALRSKELDDAPRGAGVITCGVDPKGGAKAATHLTAKWGGNTALERLYLDGVHVIRLSFDGNIWKKINLARNAVDIITDSTGALFGVHDLGSSDVLDWTAVTHRGTGAKNATVWQRRKEAEAKHCPVTWVGHGVSGASITNIVADTRQTVRRLLENLN